jgi:hypothetical protein
MSNGDRTTDQQRDGGNVSSNRQVWRQQRQWSTTPTAAMQPHGLQPSASAPYNTTFNGQWKYIDPLQQRTMQNYARCTYCDRQHPFGKLYCPTANVQCFRCARIGHLAKMGRSAPRAQRAMYQNSQYGYAPERHACSGPQHNRSAIRPNENFFTMQINFKTVYGLIDTGTVAKCESPLQSIEAETFTATRNLQTSSSNSFANNCDWTTVLSIIL